MQVHLVKSEDSFSAGDALRHLDSLNVIKSDFILLSSDSVSNIKLEKVLKQHQLRFVLLFCCVFVGSISFLNCFS
jgi:translation initiation factor eIF-2B subunit epsilon